MRIYLCPAMMDWLVFLILFAVLYGAGERGMSMTHCAWLGGIFPLTYMITSLTIGFFLSRHNARCMLYISSILCTILGVVCIVSERFVLVMVALGILAFFFAVFFNAFQAFMRKESAPGNMAHAVGFYTLAWSLGGGLGYFSSGFFYHFGPTILSGINVLGGMFVLGVLLAHKPRAEHELSAEDHEDQSPIHPVNPAYILIGWLIIFTAGFIQRPIQTFFPAIGGQTGIAAFVTSLPLFLMMVVQGVLALCMIRLRHIFYNKVPLWLFHGGAALVFLLMWKWPWFSVCFIGITLLGIYTGFAYFSAVYYANNSGRRSFNVGVNECLVGLGSFMGLFICMWWMKHSSNDNAMYLVCALMLLVSAAIQSIIAPKRKKIPKQLL